MFGSRNDDDKKIAKRRMWPWGRRNEQSQEEIAVEQPPTNASVQKVSPSTLFDESSDKSTTTSIVVTPDTVERVEPRQFLETSAESPEEERGLFARMRQKLDHHSDAPESQENKQEHPSSPPKKENTLHPSKMKADTMPEKTKEAIKTIAAKETPLGQTIDCSHPSDIQVFDTPAELNSTISKDEVSASGGLFAKMRTGLSKTRTLLVSGVTELFIGRKEIDDDLLEELETQLLIADVGVEATTDIIGKLTERVKYKELDNVDALLHALKDELRGILEPANQPLIISKEKKPYVILVVGVNGVGKTTTIGKLASKLQKQKKRIMLAAGDTFRAAAVEQLQVWGERNNVPVIAQHTGADSASVIYDAFEAATARDVDVVIADTAGRLHNKEHLMQELKKVKRVLGKLNPEAPHEVLLVVDAGTGQNALSQAKLFHESVGLTGMALTKLDGTAKGGIIFALSRQMKLPIRFLGVGEKIEDLRPFIASEFVDALFDSSKK